MDKQYTVTSEPYAAGSDSVITVIYSAARSLARCPLRRSVLARALQRHTCVYRSPSNLIYWNGRGSGGRQRAARL